MREVVLDTETTGLDPTVGHRVIEVGCVELVNHLPSGREYQTYVNPERDVPEDAHRVHGISAGFLSGQPRFADIVDELVAFLGDAMLVMHNADFDMGFLNAELTRLDRPPLPVDRVIDTMRLARGRFPGSPANLDALCRRFEIDLTARAKHGALLDAQLLAAVYLELIGGRQPGLGLATHGARGERVASGAPFRAPRAHGPSPEERAAHERFIAELKNPLWRG